MLLDGVYDETQKMLTWFEWGFFLSVIATVAGFIGHFVGCTKNHTLLCIEGFLLSCALCCGNLAWFVVGQTILWGQTSQFCKDYMPHSTNFVTGWIIAEYVVLVGTPIAVVAVSCCT